MIAEDFRLGAPAVRVLATESLVGLRGAFSRGARLWGARMKTQEHVRAQGAKPPGAVPAFRWRATPIRPRPNPTALGEGAASVLPSRDQAQDRR